MTTASSPRGLHPARKPDRETDENRFYDDVSFASSEYIGWMIGSLRLGNCDLARMKTSGVPVLRSHQGDKVVGAVERVGKSNGLWRANWRLPKIPANRDSFDQMDTGILRGVSVGANLNWDTLTLDNEDTIKSYDDAKWTADWMLVEQSLTPIPADTTSGVDRELAEALERGAVFDTLINASGITTRPTPELRQLLQSLVQDHNETVSLRREQTMTTANEIKDIPAEVVERAIAAQLERSESLKALTKLPTEITRLSEALDAEAKSNMEYRQKLDKMQFQPGGQVPQVGNWTSDQPVLDLGVVMRLTRTDDSVLPSIHSDRLTSFEESVIERSELTKRGPNVLATIPFEALAERERQIAVRRSTMAQAGGTVATPPSNISILGNGGLVLASWSPILSRMDVRFVGNGEAKAPWATAQPTAAAGAEGSDIPITNLVINDVPYRPKSIASAYEITSSLRAVDDAQFESVARMAIMDVTYDQLTSQILVGGGTDEITGIWNKPGVTEHEYGAAQNNFDRDDILDWYDAVRLSKTDGGMFTAVLSTNLWKLCERTPRATDGTSSAGYTEISMYMLEPTMPHEGRMEREMAYLYQDLAPAGIVDPGLFFKGDRCCVWMFGDGFDVEYIPQIARKDVFKLVAEANMEMYRPAENAARIKQS